MDAVNAQLKPDQSTLPIWTKLLTKCTQTLVVRTCRYAKSGSSADTTQPLRVIIGKLQDERKLLDAAIEVHRSHLSPDNEKELYDKAQFKMIPNLTTRMVDANKVLNEAKDANNREVMGPFNKLKAQFEHGELAVMGRKDRLRLLNGSNTAAAFGVAAFLTDEMKHLVSQKFTQDDTEYRVPWVIEYKKNFQEADKTFQQEDSTLQDAKTEHLALRTEIKTLKAKAMCERIYLDGEIKQGTFSLLGPVTGGRTLVAYLANEPANGNFESTKCNSTTVLKEVIESLKMAIEAYAIQETRRGEFNIEKSKHKCELQELNKQHADHKVEFDSKALALDSCTAAKRGKEEALSTTLSRIKEQTGTVGLIDQELSLVDRDISAAKDGLKVQCIVCLINDDPLKPSSSHRTSSCRTRSVLASTSSSIS
jgi:hypothetical protein